MRLIFINRTGYLLIMKSSTQKPYNHKDFRNLNINNNLPVMKLFLNFLHMVVKEGL